MRENIKIKNENNFFIPLLVNSYKSISAKKQISIINVNEKFLEHLMENITKDNAPFLHLDRSLPMIYPPAKWEDFEFGGYYLRPTNLIRLGDGCDPSIKYADLT